MSKSLLELFAALYRPRYTVLLQICFACRIIILHPTTPIAHLRSSWFPILSVHLHTSPSHILPVSHAYNCLLCAMTHAPNNLSIPLVRLRNIVLQCTVRHICPNRLCRLTMYSHLHLFRFAKYPVEIRWETHNFLSIDDKSKNGFNSSLLTQINSK